jgi:glycosyltransferase involved in cell wall biosynthesis
LAQTYENWECLLVDDSSTDNPEKIVSAARDQRIRYVRLDKHRGRGFARQVTQNQAKGEFLAMLDADDWLYPGKLQIQVETMRRLPSLALLSAGMAIVDPHCELSGIRGCGGRTEDLVSVHQPLQRLVDPPVAFAPSMIRADAGKQFSFRNAHHYAEDADYLFRLLSEYPFGILAKVTYVYREHGSVTIEKVLKHAHQRRIQYLAYRSHFPIASFARAAMVWGKAELYRVLAAGGAWRWAIERRSQQPTAKQRIEFEAARKQVEETALSIFGSMALSGALTEH